MKYSTAEVNSENFTKLSYAAAMLWFTKRILNMGSLNLVQQDDNINKYVGMMPYQQRKNLKQK